MSRSLRPRGDSAAAKARGYAPKDRRGRGSRLARGLLAAAAVATMVWAAPAGADSAAGGLPDALDTLLADPRMEGAAASVVVADADSGKVLYEHRGGDRLLPASNTKLLTSTAAMDVLGPGYRFGTDVLATGRRHGATLSGDLYLRGTGDPTLLAADYDKLAAKVAAAGVRRVTGRLVADDTFFDDQRLGRSWAADDESAYYSAQISALSVAPDTDYDTGTVIVQAEPGAHQGDRPHVTLTPKTGYVHLDVRATTGPADSDADITVERGHGTNDIVVDGSVPAGGDTAKEWVSVWDPTGYAAAVFKDALAAHGVRVAGDTRLGAATPNDARPLAGHRSMTLSDLLIPFLKLSNNMHAEILTKAMGEKTAGRGTWTDGLTAVDTYLKGLGVDTSRLRQVDGSGLSRMDMVPAAVFTQVLTAARHEPWYDDWYRGLPVACDPDRFTGGSLRSRMCDTPAALNARGKTGSLTGASALSGYVTDASGRELAYSILLNNYLADSVEDIEDAVVVTLASSTPDKTVTVKPTTPHTTTRGGAPATAGPRGLECDWRKPAPC
ncbi:D-alanyl-D-alanine carboxypeptidase/D-alanyl-D-alanine-endopeptidase [Streptomyces sp. NPDC050560]|uniref:D-alanyl-D-alanine carboxypeptidase/D-alanyl-D-alanine endopeptidase n=1 Tax=Streptomyces sp. NPDC050560 TaxID=3365630 RepID=UPI00378C7D24